MARNLSAAAPCQGTTVDLDYMKMTEHLDLFEGDYEFVLGPIDGRVGEPLTLPQTLYVVRGRSDTVALVGLVIEGGPVVADDGGFLD